MSKSCNFSPTAFLCLILGCRIIIGVANSTIQTTSLAMLTTLFPETVSENVAKVEMALAVGLIIGPLIGSLLIGYVGFYLPFLIMSGLYGVLFFVGLIALPGA